jgi:hypothetical protein
VSGGGGNLGTAALDVTAPNIVGTVVVTGGGAIIGSPSNGDPLLGALGFNGGPGMATLAPAPGSPALTRGVSCPAVDERGVARPTGLCDLGAFQRSAAPSVTPPIPILAIPHPDLSILRVTVSGRGKLRIIVRTTGAGSLRALATALRPRKPAKHAVKRTVARFTYGATSAMARGPGTLAITVKPSRAATSLLERGKRLKVMITVKFLPTTGGAVTKASTARVKLAKAKRKRK